MRIIYWNMHGQQSSWNSVGWLVQEPPQAWRINNVQNNLGLIPFVPDIMIMAEPAAVPTRVYNPYWQGPGRGPDPLVWTGGALLEYTPTPAPNDNPFCIRRFDLRGMLPSEDETLYVVWNNDLYDVRSNAVVNQYMQQFNTIQQVRPPVAIDVFSRTQPVVFRMAAVHLSSTQQVARNASLTTWIQQVVLQSGANANFQIGCMIGDFNLTGVSFGPNGEFQQRTLPSPLPNGLPQRTSLSPAAAGAANFVNSFDKVVTSLALGGVATPQPSRSGRVFGPPGQLLAPAAYADLSPIPPYFPTLASDHVPIYVEYLGF